MSQEFGHKSSILNNGIPINQWIKLYITSEYLYSSKLVEVYKMDGTKLLIPFHQASFLMYNFKTNGTSTFAQPIMCENKVAYFDISEIYMAWASLQSHVLWKTEYHGRVAIIPLGSPVSNTIEVNIPWQQSARMYLSKGKNNLNMSNDNLAIMLWNMLSSIAYSMVSAKTQTESESLCNLLYTITLIIKEFVKGCKTVYGITLQLQKTTVTQDNGQHVLSLCLDQKVIDHKMLLNILHTTLKRTYKHTNCLFLKKSDTHPILGLILTMILAPLFNEFLNNMISYDEFFSEYNKTFTEINEKILSEKVKYTNRCVISEVELFSSDLEIVKLIVSKVGLPENHDGYSQLIDHAQRNKMVSIPCRSDYWGIIQTINPFIEINTEYLFLNNKKERLMSEAFIDNKTTEIISVTSSHTTEWSAITFKTNGKYSIKVECLGVSEQGRGNSAGKEYTANMRFTFGNYLLPTDREGYSIAGIHYTNGKYISKRQISIERDIILELTDKELIISNPMEIIRLPRKFSIETVMIGFKNVIFYISPYKTIVKLAPAALLL